ncbi:MAG: hypothetical protein ACI4IS_03475 [Acutalibacteraceae bacterium]
MNFDNDYEQNPLAELPLGLGMALPKYPRSMSYFASLSENEQQIVNQCHSINSKQEMQDFVKHLQQK